MLRSISEGNVTPGGSSIAPSELRQSSIRSRPSGACRGSPSMLASYEPVAGAGTPPGARSGDHRHDARQSSPQRTVAFGVFLWAFPERLERRTLLRMLHRLRSLAHVIDMHQLSKDPEQLS